MKLGKINIRTTFITPEWLVILMADNNVNDYNCRNIFDLLTGRANFGLYFFYPYSTFGRHK